MFNPYQAISTVYHLFVIFLHFPLILPFSYLILWTAWHCLSPFKNACYLATVSHVTRNEGNEQMNITYTALKNISQSLTSSSLQCFCGHNCNVFSCLVMDVGYCKILRQKQQLLTDLGNLKMEIMWFKQASFSDVLNNWHVCSRL